MDADDIPIDFSNPAIKDYVALVRSDRRLLAFLFPSTHPQMQTPSPYTAFTSHQQRDYSNMLLGPPSRYRSVSIILCLICADVDESPRRNFRPLSDLYLPKAGRYCGICPDNLRLPSRLLRPARDGQKAGDKGAVFRLVHLTHLPSLPVQKTLVKGVGISL